MSTDIITLVDGYDRRRTPGTSRFRLMTVREAQLLRVGERVPFLSNDGKARDVTVNGKPKTWKTRPAHVKVPLKYGMYEYAYAESYGDHLDAPVEKLLVAVTGNTAGHDMEGL